MAFSFLSAVIARPDYMGQNGLRANRKSTAAIRVLSEVYATQIARNWNTKDEASGFVGYVLRFEVRSDFLTYYEVHTVGSSEHREYWIV